MDKEAMQANHLFSVQVQTRVLAEFNRINVSPETLKKRGKMPLLFIS